MQRAGSAVAIQLIARRRNNVRNGANLLMRKRDTPCPCGSIGLRLKACGFEFAVIMSNEYYINLAMFLMRRCMTKPPSYLKCCFNGGRVFNTVLTSFLEIQITHSNFWNNVKRILLVGVSSHRLWYCLHEELSDLS